MQYYVMGGSGIIKNNLEDKSWKEVLKKELTYRRAMPDGQSVPLRCYIEGGNYIITPRGFVAKSSPLKDISSVGVPIPSFSCKKTLGYGGVDQENFVSTIVESFSSGKKNSGYGIAPCGTGKTLMGLEIIRRMGVSTLVVLTRSFQVQQWIKEAKDSFTDFPIYVYPQKMEKPGVMIGIVNSIHKIDDMDFFKQFGLTILDEAHHMPADTFISAIFKIYSKNILAMSAELRRTDGMEHLFNLLIGDVLVKVDTKSVKETHGVLYSLPFVPKPKAYIKIHRTREAQALVAIQERDVYIVKIITKCFHDGYNILVFSDYINHLEGLIAILPEDIKGEVGRYFGGMGNEKLRKAAASRITFVTYTMGNEGLNIPEKDCIVCATPPTSNLRQLKGRVDRELLNGVKKTPLIVDFGLHCTPDKNAKKINKFKNLGVDMIEVKL